MFQKWSHGEKVRCPQTKIGQGGWAPKGRRGWRGNWAFSRISAELSWAEATALWGTGGGGSFLFHKRKKLLREGTHKSELRLVHRGG